LKGAAIVKKIKRILTIINGRAFLVSGLALLSTFLCEKLALTADLPMSLIAIAVVFPIVFSIGGAYKRREAALAQYGAMKGQAWSIYLAARDWLEAPSAETLERAKQNIGDLMRASRTLLISPRSDMAENERTVHREFSNLSRLIREELRQNGLAGGEVSRCNQYLNKMLVAFESLKHIYQYRTPTALRAFSDFFIVVMPIAYGPFFAQMAEKASHGLHYVMPVLLSMILVSLDNIQDQLEDPFDQLGEDDIKVDAEKFVARLEL
jgi:predicted membrane chloride channel (bestrophin family)